MNEIISGITLYFDKALGNNLLYGFERAQYVEQSRQGDGPLIAVPPPPAPAADADGMDVDGAGTSNGNGTGNANGQAQAQAQAQAPVLVRTDPPRDPGRPGGRKKAMSEIYGAEHLLRLFGKLLLLFVRSPRPRYRRRHTIYRYSLTRALDIRRGSAGAYGRAGKPCPANQWWIDEDRADRDSKLWSIHFVHEYRQ